MSLGEHTEATRVPWRDWHRQCAWLPELQARLRLVCREIRAALDNAPPGKLRLLSLCAGDGRDVLAALADHPRRADVHAVLLETDAEAISCGRASARPAGLETRTEFVEADAGRTDSYVGRVPAAVVVLSGFLGHLRLEDVARPKLFRPARGMPGGPPRLKNSGAGALSKRCRSASPRPCARTAGALRSARGVGDRPTRNWTPRPGGWRRC